MNCAYIKDNGDPCQATLLQGDEFCFFHSPKTEAQRRQAHSDGGRATALKVRRLIPTHMGPDGPEIQLETIEDAETLIQNVANWLVTGKVGPPVGNALVNAAKVFIEAKKLSEYDQRLEAVETAQEDNEHYAKQHRNAS